MRLSKSNIVITVLSFICIAGIALLLKNITIDQSPTLDQMLSEQDRSLISRNRQLFNIKSEPVVLAIVNASSPLADSRISELEDALQSIDGVSNTLSSVSIQQYELGSKKLFRMMDNTEIILLMMEPDVQQLSAAKKLSDRIKQNASRLLQEDESALIIGLPQIRAASWSMARQDLKTMLPLLVLLTVIITLLLFKSFAALTLSLFLASLTTAICLTGHLFLRADINPFIIMIIPVIWAISILDVFHLYSRTTIKLKRNEANPVIKASNELFMPCLLTSITTAGCFLTLAITDYSSLLTTVGIWGASGTIIAFVLTFTVGKYFLSLNPSCNLTASWPGIVSVAIVRFAQKNAASTLFFWVVLTLFALYVVAKLQISTPFPQVFAPGTVIATEIEQLKKLTGSDLNPVDIIIEASDSHGKKTSSILSAALSISSYLNTIDETRLILPVDLMNYKNRQQIVSQWRTGEGSQKTVVTPDTNNISFWVNQEKHAARIQVYMAELSYERKQEIFDWLRHFDETMMGHHKVTLSGSGFFYHQLEKQGLKSLLLSSLLSLFIIALTMLWITHNKRQLVIALSATLVPALILAGCMAAFNIPWTIALLPLPVILLGLMVDDTIHILWCSRQSDCRLQPDNKRFFQYNALIAGPALLATTLVLSCAAATLMLSGLQTNYYLGILIPVGLIVAYLCNLSLIPALNSWSRRSTRLSR